MIIATLEFVTYNGGLDGKFEEERKTERKMQTIAGYEEAIGKDKSGIGDKDRGKEEGKK